MPTSLNVKMSIILSQPHPQALYLKNQLRLHMANCFKESKALQNHNVVQQSQHSFETQDLASFLIANLFCYWSYVITKKNAFLLSSPNTESVMFKSSGSF